MQNLNFMQLPSWRNWWLLCLETNKHANTRTHTELKTALQRGGFYLCPQNHVMLTKEAFAFSNLLRRKIISAQESANDLSGKNYWKTTLPKYINSIIKSLGKFSQYKRFYLLIFKLGKPASACCSFSKPLLLSRGSVRKNLFTFTWVSCLHCSFATAASSFTAASIFSLSCSWCMAAADSALLACRRSTHKWSYMPGVPAQHPSRQQNEPERKKHPLLPPKQFIRMAYMAWAPNPAANGSCSTDFMRPGNAFATETN